MGKCHKHCANITVFTLVANPPLVVALSPQSLASAANRRNAGDPHTYEVPNLSANFILTRGDNGNKLAPSIFFPASVSRGKRPLEAGARP